MVRRQAIGSDCISSDRCLSYYAQKKNKKKKQKKKTTYMAVTKCFEYGRPLLSYEDKIHYMRWFPIIYGIVNSLYRVQTLIYSVMKSVYAIVCFFVLFHAEKVYHMLKFFIVCSKKLHPEEA